MNSVKYFSPYEHAGVEFMSVITLQDWMNKKTHGHTFKATSGYSSANNNIRNTFRAKTTLEMNGETYTFQAGDEYCIFKLLKPNSDAIAVSFFAKCGKIVSVRQDGTVKRRQPYTNHYA